MATSVQSPAVMRRGSGRDEPEPLPSSTTTMAAGVLWTPSAVVYENGVGREREEEQRSLRRNASPGAAPKPAQADDGTGAQTPVPAGLGSAQLEIMQARAGWGGRRCRTLDAGQCASFSLYLLFPAFHLLCFASSKVVYHPEITSRERHSFRGDHSYTSLGIRELQ